jgi:DnaJ domain
MGSSEEVKNYYAILGAAEDASQEEIERLYKRLAIRHHPDRGGDAEYMKAINEAYQVLGNEAARHAYDASRERGDETPLSITPPLSPPSSLLPKTLFGRLLGALFFLCGGLLFLFLVRIYYIRFMWPILLLAVLIVLLGLWKLHQVMISARNDLSPAHVLHHYIWAQECAFWSLAGLSAYGLFRLLTAM